jgi:hypothetical protein
MPEPMPPLAYLQHDDLLDRGSGIARLRAMTPPAVRESGGTQRGIAPRRALWTNWRGIADLAPGGGYGELYGSLAPACPGASSTPSRRVRRRAAAASRDGAGA